MQTLIHALNVYAPLALLLSFLGVAYKASLHLARVFTRRRFHGQAPNAVDAPPRLGFLTAVSRVLVFPTKRFSLRSNPVFALGAVFYHVGIVTISAGYAASVAILGYHLFAGHPIPDVSTGAAASDNLSISNLFAIIFGNAEPLQSRFLFGPLARAFVVSTSLVVVSALVGNTLLLLTHLRGRSGAVLGDLDPAAKGLRVRGMFKPSHLAVTALVYAIIWTELLARLDVVHGMVYVHAMLGATLILVFPYTYLFHMLYGFVGVYYAARRWQARYIA